MMRGSDKREGLNSYRYFKTLLTLLMKNRENHVNLIFHILCQTTYPKKHEGSFGCWLRQRTL